MGTDEEGEKEKEKETDQRSQDKEGPEIGRRIPNYGQRH
jgi:hypothetical protein